MGEEGNVGLGLISEPMEPDERIFGVFITESDVTSSMPHNVWYFDSFHNYNEVLIMAMIAYFS